MRYFVFFICFLFACQSAQQPEKKEIALQPDTAGQSVVSSLVIAKDTPSAEKPVAPKPPTVQKPVHKVAEIVQPADAPAVVTAPPPPNPKPVVEAALSHEKWNILLQKHVSSGGNVNYSGFQNDRASLNDYLRLLADNPPQSNWSRDEKMAYWINAYNAFTIDLIVKHYPLKSILDLDGGKTWDVARITLGGKQYSLNQIENEILRPQFKDARIHFAINCAAKSCPPLWNKAFTAKNLPSALDQRTRQFINDPKFNTLKGGAPAVSKIFEWYAADFGDLRVFLNRYAKVKIPAGLKIGFREYDWGVNG